MPKKRATKTLLFFTFEPINFKIVTSIKLFEAKQVRSAWNEEEQKWYFSVQDVVEVLTDSRDVKQYIKKMRSRDRELDANWGTICTPVEMTAAE